MSWQATAAPTSAGIPRIPSVFFAFASSETVHLACGGHADDESAREICAHENSAQLSLLSLFPTYSFPSSLGPIFVSSLRFKFRGKVETRGSFKSATCAGYNIWILKSIFFVAKDFSGCYDRIERIPASKFKHVSSTCIQPYF